MKIKCPFCKTHTQIQISDHPRLLINHLTSSHYDRTCIEEYSNLVMRIHERIKSLENDGRLLKMQPVELLIEELKSLLEDNQK